MIWFANTLRLCGGRPSRNSGSPWAGYSTITSSLADQADRVAHPFGRRIPMPRDMITPPALPPLSTRSECMTGLRRRRPASSDRPLRGGRGLARPRRPARAPGRRVPRYLGRLERRDRPAPPTPSSPGGRRATRRRGDGAGRPRLHPLPDRRARRGGRLRPGPQSPPRGHADKTCEAAALDTLGIILSLSAMYVEALACHDQALVVWRDLGDRHGEADALSHSGMPAVPSAGVRTRPPGGTVARCLPRAWRPPGRDQRAEQPRRPATGRRLLRRGAHQL